jgi:hypothetical protein
MKLPAAVRVSGIPSEFPTETENVSARGIFFNIDRWMTEGSRVEITMSFPPQVTMSDPVRVRFLARVVRVHEKQPMRVGVAAVIEEYEFIRPRIRYVQPGSTRACRYTLSAFGPPHIVTRSF